MGTDEARSAKKGFAVIKTTPGPMGARLDTLPAAYTQAAV